jgi:hypothetical protein
MLAMDLKSSGKKAYRTNTIKILFKNLYSVKVGTVIPIYDTVILIETLPFIGTILWF